MKRLIAILLTVFLFACVSCRNNSIYEQTTTTLIYAADNATTDAETSAIQAETKKTDVVSVSSTTKQNTTKATTLEGTTACVVSAIGNTKAEKTTKFKTTKQYFDNITIRTTQATTKTTSTSKSEKPTIESPTATEYTSPTIKTTSKPTTKSNPTCTISIDCSSLMNNMDKLSEGKRIFVPASGKILDTVTVDFEYGETVFDILKRACATNCCSDNCKYCQKNGIQLEHSYSAGFDNYYIEGIHQIYEKDCGSKSGWMFKVNGVYPNEGCSSYKLKNGDKIEWVYTCNLGEDI